jgi:anti-sigma-K factor RskA
MDEQNPLEKEVKPAPRRMRRHQRLKAQRRAQQQADTNFYRAVFSVASVGAAFAIGIGVWFMNGAKQPSGVGTLADPWIGDLTKIEVIVFVFVIILAGITVLRLRKK